MNRLEEVQLLPRLPLLPSDVVMIADHFIYTYWEGLLYSRLKSCRFILFLLCERRLLAAQHQAERILCKHRRSRNVAGVLLLLLLLHWDCDGHPTLFPFTASAWSDYEAAALSPPLLALSLSLTRCSPLPHFLLIHKSFGDINTIKTQIKAL